MFTTITNDDLLCEILGALHLIEKRDCEGPEDYGDLATRLKQLKRRGKEHSTFDIAKDFGIYLGEYQGKWYVGIKNIMFELVGLEAYESLPELKQQWILD